MKISDDLDALRSSVTGCHTVAYADISSGLVLSVSAARRRKQEEMDRLSARAREYLDAPVPPGLDPAATAIDLAPDSTTVFLRSPAEPLEVLCCVGSSAMDVGQLLAAARDTMGRLGA